MNKRRHSVLSDLSFQAIMILMFVAVLFLSFDHVNLATNGIILCITTILFLITYFTSIKVGFILNIIFLFLLIAITVLETFSRGTRIPANIYFWIVWPVAMVTAISFYVRQHQLLDEENKELIRRIEKYVTIDEMTQMNNLLGFERDAAVYMNISRRYQMELELVLWKLTYQDDLERLLGKEDMKTAIRQISAAIKNSLRKEDLVYLVDTDPYIWGTLLFSKPEAAEIVISHVKEGVVSAGLNELTKQKSYSLEISGTVVTYDGSMMPPLAFLGKAKKKLWLEEYHPEIWMEADTVKKEDDFVVEERKDGVENVPEKRQPKKSSSAQSKNTAHNRRHRTLTDIWAKRLPKKRK